MRMKSAFMLIPWILIRRQLLKSYAGRTSSLFGNDQNDIELFKTSLYSVQIGDFAGLTPYADDTLELKGAPSPAVAAKILQTFAEFKGK